MRIIQVVFMMMAMFAAQQVFADDVSNDKSCSTIADACLKAGFVKTESETKGIWHDCMKPIILGKTVANVTVDSSTVKACRMHKIEELKMDVKEFEKAN